MTSATIQSTSRINPNALLPRLCTMLSEQWKAWQAARRAAHADEMTWNMALQDARMMADLSRAMTEAADRR